ncbi:aldo/keto reductase [Amycolatopsis suaedae]|uniref:aldo/keto reductase n=1 Tax=Amycolatopsis suaedae TaxID=2510978 RepID=UPI0030B7F6F2
MSVCPRSISATSRRRARSSRSCPCRTSTTSRHASGSTCWTTASVRASPSSPWGPLAHGDLDALGSFAHIDGLAGLPAAQIALAWLLRRSPVMPRLPGTATHRLEENVHAAAAGLTDEQYQRITVAAGPPPRTTPRTAKSGFPQL